MATGTDGCQFKIAATWSIDATRDVTKNYCEAQSTVFKADPQTWLPGLLVSYRPLARGFTNYAHEHARRHFCARETPTKSLRALLDRAILGHTPAHRCEPGLTPLQIAANRALPTSDNTKDNAPAQEARRPQDRRQEA